MISEMNFFFYFFFNKEFKLENQLIDLFSDWFSFYSCFFCAKKHMEKLDEIMLKALFNPTLTIVVSNKTTLLY